MKYIFFLFLILNISCSSDKNLSGYWKINIDLQGNQLPVIVFLKQNDKEITGHMVNSTEKIPLFGKLIDNKFEIQIDANYAMLIGEFKGNSLKGYWVRTNRENYSLAFSGKKTSLKQLYKKYEKMNPAINLAGKWKISLSENKFGLGLLEQVGARITGSILTETGDYRYLDGYISGNSLLLTGFDGTFSNFISLKIGMDKFIGTIFSGKTYNKEISGIRDENFSLKNPFSIASAKKSKIEKFKYQDFLGEELIDFSNDRYKDQVKVIQVFGSWCPNCIDETRFFLKWRKNNLAKLNNVKFIAMAFEKFEDKKHAVKALRKVKRKLGIDYPIILADYQTTKTVTEFIPINNFSAFPTTIFLNRKNEIIKIHTGFNGQATGKEFLGFTHEFNQIIDTLIRE